MVAWFLFPPFRKGREQEVGSCSLTSANFSFQRNTEVNSAGRLNDRAAICFCSQQVFGKAATSVKCLSNIEEKRAAHNLRGVRQGRKVLVATGLQ